MPSKLICKFLSGPSSVSSFYIFLTEDAADGTLKNLQINVEGISEDCNLPDMTDTDKMKSENMAFQHHQRQSYKTITKNKRKEDKSTQVALEFFCMDGTKEDS